MFPLYVGPASEHGRGHSVNGLLLDGQLVAEAETETALQVLTAALQAAAGAPQPPRSKVFPPRLLSSSGTPKSLLAFMHNSIVLAQVDCSPVTSQS